jgi:RNA polymerase sigma factor (sigma-70 family)
VTPPSPRDDSDNDGILNDRILEVYRDLLPMVEGFLKKEFWRLRADLRVQVADDAFLALRRAWGRELNAGRQVTDPLAYLCSAARNAAIKLLQARYISEEIPDSDFLDFAVDDKDAITELDFSDDLYHHLGKLPPKQRSAVVLRHLLGFSGVETAQILGVKPGTIASNTKDGLARLRHSIERQQRLDDDFREEDAE